MKIIGHRGAKGLAPENTITSFKKALDLSVDMIEFDVHVTRDHYPVVHHDQTVVDDSGHKLKIAAATFKELQAHKPDLPSLAEVLKFIDGKVPLYIEVKMGVDVGPIILELKHYKHKFFLASKSQKTLSKLHQAFPEITKIVIEPFSVLRAVWRAWQVDTRVIAMNQTFMWPGMIRKLASRQFELYAYPLNDPDKAERWEAAGLTGVITDFPNRFV